MPKSKRVLAIGDQLPNVALQTVDGRTIRLGDCRGKRLLVFMWASW